MNICLWKRVCLSFVFIPAMMVSAWAKPTGKWLPVTVEELQLKDCPGMPGAPALCLFREEYFHHEDFVTRVYRRIKILTAEGRQYANVEISYLDGIQFIDNLKIRSITPEGNERPFNGKIFEKTAVGRGRTRLMLKTFTIPDVNVGDIIEYRYTVGFNYLQATRDRIADLVYILSGNLNKNVDKPFEGGENSGEILSEFMYQWNIQDTLYTLKARFLFKPNKTMSIFFAFAERLNWLYQKLYGARPIQNSDEEIELELDNIPPFEKEDYMTPEANERMNVMFFYCQSDVKGSENFWPHEIDLWRKGVKKFIGDTGDLSGMAAQLTADQDQPLQKLQKIYEWVQQLKNLSYEPGLLPSKWKDKGYKTNKNAADILKNKYGCRSDITRTFVALARAAKLDAQVIRVVTRDDKLFRMDLLDMYAQFDSEVVLVKTDDRTIYLDPATPFCPFGMVHWSRSGTVGVREVKGDPEFIDLPNYSFDKASIQREISLALDPGGELKGIVKVTYSGQDALEWRLSAIGNDEVGLRKDFEDDLIAILPNSAKVTLQKIENIGNNQPFLIVYFDVVIPNLAAVAGQKILLPLSPLEGRRQHPFRSSKRTYPIYFSYAFETSDDLTITLPLGIKLEGKPNPTKIATQYFAFSLVTSEENNNTLHIKRNLQMKWQYFETNQYPSLKNFYDQVVAADEQQMVLTGSSNDFK